MGRTRGGTPPRSPSFSLISALITFHLLLLFIALQSCQAFFKPLPFSTARKSIIIWSSDEDYYQTPNSPRAKPPTSQVSEDEGHIDGWVYHPTTPLCHSLSTNPIPLIQYRHHGDPLSVPPKDHHNRGIKAEEEEVVVVVVADRKERGRVVRVGNGHHYKEKVMLIGSSDDHRAGTMETDLPSKL